MDNKDYIIKRITRRQKCLFDDGLFTVAAYKKPEIIEDIVMRVFTKAGIAIRGISRSEVQKRTFTSAFRDVIFDCYAETEDGVRMAVEVQNDASGFGHEREGFYLSKLRLMEDKGKGYDEMMPVYLIILHRHNPYRKENEDLPVYIKECHYAGTDIYYNDGMNVLRVNGDYMERGDVLGDLMRSMKAKKPEDAPIKTIAEAISMVAKENIDMAKRYSMEDFRNHYIEKGRAEGVKEGIAEGLAAGKAEGKADGKAEGRAEAKNEMLEAFRKLGIPEEIINKAASAKITLS